MRHALLLVSCSILVAGCVFDGDKERFSIVSSGSGTYRIDERSGQVALVTAEGVKPLQEAATPLIVGHIYLFEDGSSMKYAGKGKFESAITFSGWKK